MKSRSILATLSSISAAVLVLQASIASAQAAPVASVSAEDVFAQVISTWLVSVKPAFTAHQCAIQIEKAGVSVRNVLNGIGVVVAETPSSDSSALAAVPCVEYVEAEGFVVLQ